MDCYALVIPPVMPQARPLSQFFRLRPALAAAGLILLLTATLAGCLGAGAPPAGQAGGYGAGSGQEGYPVPSPMATSHQGDTATGPAGTGESGRFTAAPSPATQEPALTDGSAMIPWNHTWIFRGEEWSLSYAIPEQMFRYYRERPRTGAPDYAQYAVSDYDRQVLRTLASHFTETGRGQHYSLQDSAMNVIAFVQSLPYTPDNLSTGSDEYPKYPVETLVDGGGDCEDTSILTAAILHEMGIPVVLLSFPDHMAVGVGWDEPLLFTPVRYQGRDYYYLDTTDAGSTPGEVPPAFRDQPATVYPIQQMPHMTLACTSGLVSYDKTSARYLIRCNISNDGSGRALNSLLSFEILNPDLPPGSLHMDPAFVDLGNYDEWSSGWAEYTLVVPRERVSQVRCTLTGDNFLPVVQSSVPFTA